MLDEVTGVHVGSSDPTATLIRNDRRALRHAVSMQILRPSRLPDLYERQGSRVAGATWVGSDRDLPGVSEGGRD